MLGPMATWGSHKLFKVVPIQFSDLEMFFWSIQIVIMTRRFPDLGTQTETIK